MLSKTLKYSVAFLLFFLCGINAFAASVDTVTTHSASMQKDIKAVVITPAKYSKKKKYPVVYLLHGYSGNYSDWVMKVPAIKSYADAYNIIIVCADGNYNSWYIDSPEKENSKYDTYISSELVTFIDNSYSTIANRKGRAITGLSMGGHGALYLAIKHQDVYGAAGSMSGGVDLKPFEKNWELAEYVGTSAKYPERWTAYSVIDIVSQLKPDALQLTIECGQDDFFYGVNVQLHDKLTANKIPHRFTASPGSHTWEFWANAIQYQLLFFQNQFQK
jgi:S-formylglutathione hydrolase FrmB